MSKLYTLFTLVLLFTSSFVQAQDVNEKNKALFDETVEKVNFRTIEYVYDRKFPRKKFPATQTDSKTRKTFDDFEGDNRFKQLFLNYNDVSAKFKKKFGNGRNDLASFEKGLNDILINKDFEFFISGLNKDDKIQLIKSLQQINKKGIAQFVDASGKPRGFFASDSVIKESSEPIVKKQTEVTPTEVSADTSATVINTDATPEEVFQEKTPRRDWLTWLSLLCGIGALILAASAKFKDIPGLKNFVANNYQKRGEGPAPVKPSGKAETVVGTDPEMAKQLGNLTREVEGLYAQMDELLHKNTVLEQKLAGSHPKPFDLPKTAYFEPETEKEEETKPKTVTSSPKEPNAVTVTSEETEEEAEDQTGYQPFSIDEEDDFIKDEFTDETVGLPAVTFYLAKPDKQGFFWNEEIRRTFMPHQSFYEITLSENDPRKATFEFVNDKAQQKLAIENPELYLNPVCDVSGEGQSLVNETPGMLVLNADQWVLVKKAKIRCV